MSSISCNISEKAQTTMSENRFTSPKIDVFRMAILTLLVPTGDNVRASFLVHQVPRNSTTVLQYRQMFTQFSLHVWASEYTCHPIIANLLYVHCSTMHKWLLLVNLFLFYILNELHYLNKLIYWNSLMFTLSDLGDLVVHVQQSKIHFSIWQSCRN